MVSAVGDDRHGQQAGEILDGFAIDVSFLQVAVDARTGTATVELDGNDQPTFTIHENSAWDQISWTGELEQRVASADAVYFGTLAQRCQVTRETIRRALKVAESTEMA